MPWRGRTGILYEVRRRQHARTAKTGNLTMRTVDLFTSRVLAAFGYRARTLYDTM